mmetsp:Transcript_114623/g.304717  ORF Transcript_114623/g.304717 Transcript_114623/m.304717 type:complete len:200 (-) Transcript_114623:654-1253(-)
MSFSTSASWSSLIHLPPAISSLNLSVTPCVQWKISIIPPIWVSIDRKSKALDMPSKRRFSSVCSGSVLACTMNEPESVNGMMRNATGRVPSSISNTGSLRTPVSTDVGQSGPQQRTSTLSLCRPFWLRMYLMAFISGVCIATSFFTAMLFEKGSPIIFCSTATAVSLMTMEITKARSEARRKWPPPASKRLVIRTAETM